MLQPHGIDIIILLTLIAVPAFFASRGIVKVINTILFWPCVFLFFAVILSPVNHFIGTNPISSSRAMNVIIGSIIAFALATIFFKIIDKIASLPILRQVSWLVGACLGFIIAYTLVFCSLLLTYYWAPEYHNEIISQTTLGFNILMHTPIFSTLLVR